ncbi:MAG: bifunctional precorrin-2 dehydrogenase/sirohydrochlorin ferrochelatase [Planctomycetes bacterium]|nr:bifunctional precorrin-2 dehydrogenase/sirohydrochlorin ferrochelatase [Planctomycetota bacterium]
MKVLPIGLVIEGKLCVVVGSGSVAARKAAALLEAGARVRVVGKRFSADFAELDAVERVRAAYHKRYLDGARLVVAATSESAANRLVARDARAAGILVNAVDMPDECDLIFPAVTRKGDVSVAISTGGASPTLARRLKERIETSIEDAYGDLAAILKAVRQRAIEGIPDKHRRRAFFEKLAGDDFLEMITREGRGKALDVAEELLEEEMSQSRKVSLK